MVVSPLMSANNADYQVDPGDDFWLLEIPEQFWNVVAHHWPQVASVTLHWRRGGRGRYSRSVSQWEKKGDASTPEDMLRHFYADRIGAIEAQMGEDLEWRTVLYDSKGERLADAKWSSLLDPQAAGEFSLMSIVASQNSLIVKQHRIITELMEGSSGLVSRTTENFDKAMQWQTSFVEFVGGYQAEVESARAWAGTADRFISFIEDNTSFVRDTIKDFTGGPVDTATIDDVPPDLIPFAVLVLTRHRPSIERYMDVLPEEVVSDYRVRLQATKGGQKVLDTLAELFKAHVSPDDVVDTTATEA